MLRVKVFNEESGLNVLKIQQQKIKVVFFLKTFQKKLL